MLAVLIMFGLFLANYSPTRADWYWSLMFPVFGLVCLGHQLIAGDTHGMPAWMVLLKQALHWLGPIVAVRIIFLQLARGQMAADAVALMILLVLAVTCYLAGIHFDRTFVWVSVFLGPGCAGRDGNRSLFVAARGAGRDCGRTGGVLHHPHQAPDPGGSRLHLITPTTFAVGPGADGGS